jgi:hypothetical protein
MLVLVRFASATEPTLSADFDGDGDRDHAVLDHAEPTLLHVWLSSTNATATIRSQTPIIHLAATDLDGDRRSELIAGDRTGLRIWTKTHHDFRSYRPRRAAPATLASPIHRALHESTTDSQSDVTWSADPTLAVLSRAGPRAPTPGAVIVRPTVASRLRSALPHSPFAPRPPPHSA